MRYSFANDQEEQLENVENYKHLLEVVWNTGILIGCVIWPRTEEIKQREDHTFCSSSVQIG